MWRCAEYLPFMSFGGGRGGGFLSLLLWGIILFGIAFVAYRALSGTRKNDLARTDRNDAMDILKLRLAEGKITPEEYDRMKRIIAG